MGKELLIKADHDVALKYKEDMERSALLSFLIGCAFVIAGRYSFPLYLISVVCFILALISFRSRNAMLKLADKYIDIFRFTPEGWYRGHETTLYRWQDFKKVEYSDRCITFRFSKKHRIHSYAISPMLMTDSDFDKAKRWIEEHLPEHLK